MDDASHNLDAAYRATSYTAETPFGQLVLRIGSTNAELDRLLEVSGVTSWAYITAHNPASRPASDIENATRQNELRALVEQAGHLFYEGAGIGEGWLPETSLLILGMKESEAALLGRRFRQLAIVVGERGNPARLVWLKTN